MKERLLERMNIKGVGQKLKNCFWKKSVENLFLVIALFGGIAMACINPPFQECDGWEHFLRVVDVSYGNVLSPIAELNHGDGVIVVPETWKEIDYRIVAPGSKEGGALVQELKNLEVSSETIEHKFDGGIMSLFYYPQALGFFMGRLFGMSMYGCILFSRIVNLLVFLALAWYAIRITPVFKNIMAVIALFPMTIYQAASQSPDAMLNGLCFLFISLCFYYAYGEREHLDWKDALKISSVLALVFLCKYVYVCLGLLVFLIPYKKFGDKKSYGKAFAIALIPLVILGMVALTTAGSVVASSQANAEGVSQASYVMQHPKFLAWVLINTFNVKFQDYMLWLNTLGSLNYSLGPLIYIVPMFAMFVGALDVNNACIAIKRKDRILCLVSFLLVSLGIVLGIYIGDGRINPIGTDVVQGVQGRYFIAILPVLFAGISMKKIENKNKHFTGIVLGGMAVMLLYSAFVLKMHCY